MRTSFALIFWGLLVVFVDITINGVDLAPDGLGYVLIAFGAMRLTAQSPQFGATSGLSALLAVAWLVGFFVPGNAFWQFTQLVALLYVAMQWTLLGGIIEIALTRNRADLAERAGNRRLAYAIVVALGLFVSYAFQNAGQNAFPLVILLAVPAFIIAIMILHLVYRVSREMA